MFGDVRRKAAVRRGKPEEAGESQRLNPRIDALERAAKHLRTNVDAECGLDDGRRTSMTFQRRRQRLGQFTLRAIFARCLQDGVDALVVARLDRPAMRGHRRAPGIGDLVFVLEKQRLLPHQADGEKIGDRVIGSPGKFCLPQLVSRNLCPTAQRYQQAMEICRYRCRTSAQPGRRTRQRPGRRLGRVGDEACEPAQTGDLGRQVMRRDRLPRGIGTLSPRRRPQCLPLVEIAGGPRAKSLGDDRRPVDSRSLGGKVGDCRQGWRRYWRHGGGSFQRGDRCQPELGVRGRQRRGEIVVRHRAAIDPLAIPGSRHRDPGARDPRHQGSGAGKIEIGLAEIRVHRHARRERPHRRDGAARRICGT